MLWPQTMPALLAYESRWKNLGSAVRSKSDGFDRYDILIPILVAAAVLVIVLVCRYFATRTERLQQRSDPWELFRSLCRAHRLNWRSRWLLSRVARHQRLAQPAQVFVEMERFDPSNLSPSLVRQGARLAQLREQLFAKPSN